jgi:tRNA pseudouridine55 synthase
LTEFIKNISGILLVDKPAGITSFDVIRILKRISGIRKIGHGGTLDPLATGLLPVFLGSATKLSAEILLLNKSYDTEVLLGKSTDTGDSDGKILSEREVPPLSDEDLEKFLLKWTGSFCQKPPAFSAVKYRGKPLYKYARKGIEVDIPGKIVHVKEISLLKYNVPVLRIFIECSKGFYVRQFVHDLGETIGCGAHVISLRRLSIGNLSVDRAVSLDSLKEKPEILCSHLITADEFMAMF